MTIDLIKPRAFTVSIVWIVPDKKGDYIKKSKTFPIQATSLMEACEVALSRHRNYICVGVSSAWLDWPQAAGGSPQ